ncbi:MAG: 2-succinyl-5-enolpyruvyl-6-hydroxy-3-cyclohexene-1-carboxylic-acid synthase [Sporichthyaceae bacterium]
MNPATALARVFVDEFARCGVTEAVLSPGSRSGPLALALAAEPRIRLHVRIDERSASYLALGLAKASVTPVPLLCTSGTAAAAFHPAVLEADASGVGLLVLTADRPPELRGTGASQTVDQLHLFGRAVRMFHEVGVPEAAGGQVAYWRSLVGRAVAAAANGPAHLNLALREPLIPDVDASWPESLAGRADGSAWVTTRQVDAQPGADLAELLDGLVPECGAVIVGDGALDPAGAVALAEAAGWPVFAEPTSGARVGPNSVAAYPLILSSPGLGAPPPQVVLTVGRPGLSRSLLTWTRTAARHIVVDSSPTWADPTRTADLVLPVLPGGVGRTAPAIEWLRGWRQAGMAAAAAVDAVLDEAPLSEPAIARALGRGLPAGGLLVTGPSRPVRDLELTLLARGDIRVLANRGVNGIDGVVSTAIGAALAHQRRGGGPAYALLGDLTYLYDRNGLLLGPDEPRPDLCLVVVDNDGGGIFSTLPQAGIDGFERVFGTPHGIDICADAANVGLPAREVRDAAELSAALVPVPGLRLVRVRTDRKATANLLATLQAAVSAALH